MRRMSNNNRGFTVVELLVVAPVVLLTIGAFITVIVNLTGDVLASRASSVLVYNIQDTLGRIENDVKLSTTFLAENNVTLSSPQGYGNNTTKFQNVDSTKGNMLILNTLATTGNPLVATSGLIYLPNLPNSCSSTEITQNTPMTMNIVYFVDSTTNTLLRRSIMQSDYAAAGCSVPWQQPSCNPSLFTPTGSWGANTFCKTQDITLANNVSVNDFSVQYFSSASATTANSVASDASCAPSTADPACVAARNAALQSLSTVGASININTTAAGRTVSQSGSIRATRLDINASTIAPVIVATTPTSPSLSVSLSRPNQAVFTWPTVPGATGYTFQYQLNGTGGAWTTAFTNQNTTTFTVTGNIQDVVYGRASATNSAGTSGYSSNAYLTIPAWSTLTLKNSWVDYNGSNWTTAGYTQTSDGMIVLKGLIRSGTATSGTVIGTLPAGYRPAERLLFQTGSNGAAGRLDVDTNGDISIQIGSNAWFSLDGINFMPSGTTFTALSPLFNSWVNYGGVYATAGYMTDTSGRVHIKGLVKSGVATNDTIIGTLPAGSRVATNSYEHVSNDNSNAYSHIGLNQAGNVLAKGGSNGFLSLNALFYPASYSWTTLTLSNSWVTYGGIFSPPRYTKSTDNMVLVKGLIKSGVTTADTVIANLPTGFCPKQRVIMTIPANGVVGRVDVTSGTGAGCSILAQVVNAGYTSLDNVSFLAEW
ncbi:hypothetical protein BH10PAT4_BH10PAT4_3130 [soil metagenome]